MAVDLAKRHGARLHVLHLTTARELELFEPGPDRGASESRRRSARTTCGSTQSSYATLGTKIKCNPAIKTAPTAPRCVRPCSTIASTSSRPTMRRTRSRRRRAGYFEAPSGLPLVQHSLLMLLDQHADGLYSLDRRSCEKAAHNPAVLFGIAERGFIREGYFADLVAVDLQGVTRVDAAQVLYKCGWSPFEGTRIPRQRRPDRVERGAGIPRWAAGGGPAGRAAARVSAALATGCLASTSVDVLEFLHEQ